MGMTKHHATRILYLSNSDSDSDSDSEGVCIDRKIYGLIKFLNTLPGIETVWSCEGDSSGPRNQGYVVLRGHESERFMTMWLKQCEHVWMAHSEYNDGWHARWMKWAYLKVVRGARRAAMLRGLTK